MKTYRAGKDRSSDSYTITAIHPATRAVMKQIGKSWDQATYFYNLWRYLGAGNVKRRKER